MPYVIAQVTVVPLGTGTPSLSSYVADIERVLRKKTAIKTMLTPMATILEGELEDILQVIREIHEIPFASGAQRVSTRISIDDRRDKQITMNGKVDSVESKLSGS